MPSDVRPPLAFTRRSFQWRVASHPLIQSRLPPLDDAGAIFRSRATHCMDLVHDHVVQSRVIFPGAGYLELARAAAMTATALRGVFFLQPLALETAGLLIECAITDGRFEVRSGEGIDAMSDATPAARKIDTLVNTHSNGDHTYGNQLVGNARIITSTATADEWDEVTPEIMAQMVAASGQLGATGEFIRRAFGPFQFAGLKPRPPTQTFDC